MDDSDGAISDSIQVVPVVVVSQTFPARPSSIPDIRDFVRRCLAQSQLSADDTREVGETVSQALLEAAGPTGAISVSFRIFPDHVEVDVLKSGAQIGAPGLGPLSSLIGAGQRQAGNLDGAISAGAASPASAAPASAAAFTGPASPGDLLTGLAADASDTDGELGASGELSTGDGPSPDGAGPDGAASEDSESFADWMSGVLRREGLTMEAAARQLGVSVKTVSRWVGGTTEPRLRDLRRIRELFGEIPLT
ncbi:MAG: helix-turn-helix domain-containing protein [Nocardiopsaceae bacterium]|nr:helix-turn-helix domain-containing protein [Nocardiopsaceae bacterium]